MDKPKILIVDDESFFIDLLVELLRGDYQITIAKSGEQALVRAGVTPPDLILLDVVMPGLDGYETCRRLKAEEETRNIPVIFLTAKSDVDDEVQGLQLGAVDYINKPISPPILLTRVSTQIALKESREALDRHNRQLEEMVRERTEEIVLTQDVAIFCLASLAETRDNETGNHVSRTQHYVLLLARHIQERPHFRDLLTDKYIELLFKSAPLHDIGKVGVPDRILLHPGPLYGEDWIEMKCHADYGREAIERTEEKLGSTHFLTLAKEIISTHHEKWDGSGYPKGLKGDEIPVAGRLMAIADVYDALISRRCYKPAFTHENAVEMIKEGSGLHFDPELVDAFLALQDEFREVARRFADE